MSSNVEREIESDLDAKSPAPDPTGAAMAPTDLELGRCRLRYLVAQGGMASVYLAQLAGAAGFERWVAVKVVHPHLASDQRFVRMLLDEARITARIQHPNVCSVIDFGQDGSTCFLVMEYLHGESLASVMKRAVRGGGLPWQYACRMVADGARGLHAAHELKNSEGRSLALVHRDVSPQNLFVLYEGVTKALDFGVAQARDKLEKTQSGEVKGKLAYMAPEQLLGREVDRRTDVWALGVVLWEALAAARLFRGASDGETVQRVLNAEVVRPSRHAPRASIPREVEAIALKALERDPASRFSSAAELADALEDALHANSARAGAKEIGAWMREIFADRRALREEMMRRQMPRGIVPEVELETGRTQVTPARDRSLASIAVPRTALAEDGDSSSVRMTTPTAQTRAGGAEGPPWRALGLAAAVVAAMVAMLAIGFQLGAGPTPTEPRSIPLAPLATSPPVAGAAQIPTEPPTSTVPTASVPTLGNPAGADPVGADPVGTDPVGTDPVGTDPGGVGADPNERGAVSLEPAPTTPDRPVITPRAPRAEPRVAAAREAPGFVNVMAVPPARIYLGRRLLGETPLRGVELPAGEHQLEARPVDGEGPTRRVSVTIVSGETTRTSIR